MREFPGTRAAGSKGYKRGAFPYSFPRPDSVNGLQVQSCVKVSFDLAPFSSAGNYHLLEFQLAPIPRSHQRVAKPPQIKIHPIRAVVMIQQFFTPPASSSFAFTLAEVNGTHPYNRRKMRTMKSITGTCYDNNSNQPVR